MEKREEELEKEKRNMQTSVEDHGADMDWAWQGEVDNWIDSKWHSSRERVEFLASESKREW